MGRRTEINGRELILAAALKLFADEGIDAVSIRAVNREAGLGPASMHYHFGTKEALIEALLQLHGESIAASVAQRAENLAEDQDIDSSDIVAMLAKPFLELLSSDSSAGRDWIRFVSQLAQAEPDRVLVPIAGKATRAAIAKAYPKATPAQRDRALRVCFLLLVTQLAQIPSRPTGKLAAPDIDLLLVFLGGGLDAVMRPKDARSVASIA